MYNPVCNYNELYHDNNHREGPLTPDLLLKFSLPARNNRNLQKFQLETNGEYSKFVKFEKISHYVKEHFCVITTFQVWYST